MGNMAGQLGLCTLIYPPAMCTGELPAQTCCGPAREFTNCWCKWLQGGAIYVDQVATCNIDAVTFLSNSAPGVRQLLQKQKKTCCVLPEAMKRYEHINCTITMLHFPCTPSFHTATCTGTTEMFMGIIGQWTVQIRGTGTRKFCSMSWPVSSN
jgi:hypothetical protein